LESSQFSYLESRSVALFAVPAYYVFFVTAGISSIPGPHEDSGLVGPAGSGLISMMEIPFSEQSGTRLKLSFHNLLDVKVGNIFEWQSA
jgi:hypothetical protein